MKNVLKIFFVLLTLVQANGIAWGKEAQLPAGSKKQEWNWLSQDDKARLMKSIPPSPTLGSDLDKSDLAAVLAMQKARTPADIAEANDDQHFSLGMISKVLDPHFTEENYPKAFALLKHVDQDEYVLNSTLKKEYQRLRPYQQHKEVQPLFQVKDYSYPSGLAGAVGRGGPQPDRGGRPLPERRRARQEAGRCTGGCATGQCCLPEGSRRG
jgi:acid phosphatase (class A)